MNRLLAPLTQDALVLETERLRLTPFVMADTDIAQTVLCDPEVMRFVADAITPDAVVTHMTDAVKRGAGGRIGIWCITRKDTSEKIGDGVLIPVPIDADDTDWSQVVPDAYPDAQIEVGYLLKPSAWGQGFATEACRRLLRFAFEQTDLAEVVATTDPENAKSHHVLQKCGMRALGQKRAYGYDEVEWYEITREAWHAHTAGSLSALP